MDDRTKEARFHIAALGGIALAPERELDVADAPLAQLGALHGSASPRLAWPHLAATPHGSGNPRVAWPHVAATPTAASSHSSALPHIGAAPAMAQPFNPPHVAAMPTVARS